jgi:predicted Zn-dependent protease with MMP-like domain
MRSGIKSRSHRRFEVLVTRALELLPAEIKENLHNIVVDIEDEPSVDTLKSLGFSQEEIEGGETVFGLYEEMVPLDEGSSLSQQMPHRIVIYQRPLEREFPDRRQLMVEIRKTVIHEVAHRLGLTDEDLVEFDESFNPFDPVDETDEEK